MWPWSQNATVRIPSHLTSKPNCSSRGGSGPLRASIGLIRSGNGS